LHFIEVNDIAKSLVFKAQIFDTKQHLQYDIVETTSLLSKSLKISRYRNIKPFSLVIKNKNGLVKYRVEQGFAIFLHKIYVYDADENIIGCIIKKVNPFTDKFSIEDEHENEIAEMNVQNSGKKIIFIANENEIAIAEKVESGLLENILKDKFSFYTLNNYTLNFEHDVLFKSALLSYCFLN